MQAQKKLDWCTPNISQMSVENTYGGKRPNATEDLCVNLTLLTAAPCGPS